VIRARFYDDDNGTAASSVMKKVTIEVETNEAVCEPLMGNCSDGYIIKLELDCMIAGHQAAVAELKSERRKICTESLKESDCATKTF